MRPAALVALYPRHWRQRYGAELAALVADLSTDPGGPSERRIAADLARGALDAHIRQRRSEMRRFAADPALRRGVLAGLVIAAVIAVVAFFTVVVFPHGPNESDSDPEYLVQILAAYVLLGGLLAGTGAYARRRSPSPWAGVKGGAAAGLVIALSVVVIYLVINNVFFDVVSQQHDKRVAFARSGWTSMRAFVNWQLLAGVPTVVPMATVVGGMLGGLGGVLFGPRPESRRPTPAA
jgi:hypothetical protein